MPRRHRSFHRHHRWHSLTEAKKKTTEKPSRTDIEKERKKKNRSFHSQHRWYNLAKANKSTTEKPLMTGIEKERKKKNHFFHRHHHWYSLAKANKKGAENPWRTDFEKERNTNKPSGTDIEKEGKKNKPSGTDIEEKGKKEKKRRFQLKRKRLGRRSNAAQWKTATTTNGEGGSVITAEMAETNDAAARGAYEITLETYLEGSLTTMAATIESRSQEEAILCRRSSDVPLFVAGPI
uniref:Uncharacterized protein n=1 Tax=Odontella aurita TaxID=265563 RepID=A0A7S4IJN3_9STRA|mmetsp:Transcript_26129/g.77332  ORF Transcript_26129/g.77332 Transcript_26129/m.77332 type:complete len:236 (+) Transcript_26129:437-1144(+)|eukprot:CAMPEP_0113556472 /NCGR_PEP_ID=MMETSP0015_2-20120614/17273_1 /TAXON_ID=2838 /ORGANISM="Odontella" /LENGTH=235 /DNA_ID=CAMNT_0000457827 /DNA_START=321 /DNA_END=1028 /DNA_ORIENTATION=+ /assembly_acc=CAM_ASM_000160